MQCNRRFSRTQKKLLTTTVLLALAGTGTGCESLGGLGGLLGGGGGGIGSLLGGGVPVGGPLGLILTILQSVEVINPLDTEFISSPTPAVQNGIIFEIPLSRTIVTTAISQLPSAPGTGTACADGFIYYTERVTGRVRRFNPATDVLDPTPVIDLAVNSSGQRGLIGVCFTPTGFQMFVTYCASTTAADTLTEPEGLELRVSSFPFGGGGVTGPETVLYSAPCRDVNFPSDLHSIGPCMIGSDSRLYWACGDLDSRMLAQNPFTNDMAGKINRVNIDGSIPGDNPFGPTFITWCLGLRDPRSFTFDSENGKFWVTDVGNIHGDELNMSSGGANFGWPLIQGLNQTDPENLVSSLGIGIYVHPQIDFGYSRVTPAGVLVVRNNNYGDDAVGNVFVAQAASQARVVRWADLGGLIVSRSELFLTANESGEITNMFLGPDGFIYLLTQLHLYRVTAP